MPSASNSRSLAEEHLMKLQNQLDALHLKAGDPEGRKNMGQGLTSSSVQGSRIFKWLHDIPNGVAQPNGLPIIDTKDKDEFPELTSTFKNKTRKAVKAGSESRTLAEEKTHQEKISNCMTHGPGKTTATGQGIFWSQVAKKTYKVDSANKAGTFPKMDTAEPEMTTIDGFPIRCSQRQRKGKGKGKGKGGKGNAQLSS